MTSSAKRNLPSHPKFNVVIVYDGFVSGQRAGQTYYRIMLQHRDMADVTLKTWTFDGLNNAKCNRQAIKDAVAAQLIILATACAALPPAVKKWLEGWRSHTKKCPASFVAVLNTGENLEIDMAPVENELNMIVSSAGSEFLIEKTVPWQQADFLYEAAFA